MNKRYTKKSFDELIGDYKILKKAFELFANWAEECDFGFDNLSDLSNEYQIEIGDALASGELEYTEGLQYIALLEAKKSLKEINDDN